MILAFVLINITGFSQVQRETIWDSTRVDLNQRFIIKAPYDKITINLRDSMTQIDDTTFVSAAPYISLANSTVTFRVQMIQIFSPDSEYADTNAVSRTITKPLSDYGNPIINFLTSNPTYRPIKKETKGWMKKLFNQ